jgi:hypothetical protein
MFRLVCFQWHPNSGVNAPTVSAILQSTGATGPLSTYNHDEESSRQFTILYDKCYAMTLGTSTSQVVSNIRVPLKYAKKKVQFDAATDEGANKLYMCVISDSGAAPNPTIESYSRIIYTDA